MIGRLLLAALVLVAAAAGEDPAVQVPFRFEHNEILVQVKIGGLDPCTMMLDTDTDPSSIDLAFAQSTGMQLREIRGEVTGGGTERPKVYLTKLDKVQVGSLPGRDLAAVAMDLSKIRSGMGVAVQGVLGHNFLGGRVVQIDYPGKVLRFYRSSPALLAFMPFRIGADGDILIEGVTINGRSAKATIDTGSDGTFSVTPAAVEALGLMEAARQGEPLVSTGYRGTAQNTRGKVDRIAVGAMETPSPEVVFWGKGAGRDRRPWDVDIGNGFLKDYIVTLDYPKKRIAIARP